MKDKIINWCRGVNNWFVYVASYKENKENDLISDKKLIEKNKKIEELKLEIAGYKKLENERINLIHLREKRIHELSKKYSELKEKNKKLQEMIFNQTKCIEELTKKIQNKEISRRKSAGAIGGYKVKINELKKELDRKDRMIVFLKTNRRAPSMEEIKAYELQMKEVEKRMK